MDGLLLTAELPICRAVLWAMMGVVKTRRPVRTVAVYQRNSRGSYGYVTTRLAKPEERRSLDSWADYVIASEFHK